MDASADLMASASRRKFAPCHCVKPGAGRGLASAHRRLWVEFRRSADAGGANIRICPPLPSLLGMELAGTIEALGPGTPRPSPSARGWAVFAGQGRAGRPMAALPPTAASPAARRHELCAGRRLPDRRWHQAIWRWTHRRPPATGRDAFGAGGGGRCRPDRGRDRQAEGVAGDRQRPWRLTGLAVARGRRVPIC